MVVVVEVTAVEILVAVVGSSTLWLPSSSSSTHTPKQTFLSLRWVPTPPAARDSPPFHTPTKWVSK